MEIRLSTDPSVESLANVFARMRMREEIGGMRFPANADTLAMSQSLVEAGADLADVAVAAQQNWFRSGQTGCVFARVIAGKYSGEKWPYLVMGHEDRLPLLEFALDKLCEADEVEMASILFPQALTLGEFVVELDRLVENSSFWFEIVEHSDEGTSLHVRLPIAEGVQAWVMGFGPDETLPPTRRAPFYELAIRVKAKSGYEYYRLNQDPSAAHLADFPMQMPARHWDDRWDTTKRKTRNILGHDPDHVSAARSTLTVPNHMVDGMKSLALSDGW